MTTVDDNIVSMKFDNATFERKLSETIKSLDKLTQSLNLANSTRGLEQVSAATKNFNMGNMVAAVEDVSSRFKALSVVAITALATITSHVVTAAGRVAKSFTLDPILDGFREFETKVGSIQTILANTQRFDTGLEEVTHNLDELNDYADKTIYNFGDMTKNIGLFTNAGIRIGDATSMIKGFSNAAAASGTSAEGAASAAYQLSQALSAGTIRLMDWRSLQNVGMGNKNMQQGLIDIADAMGTLEKNGTSAIEVQENFNGSLEKNWLSADVMSTYLKIMAGEMDAAKLSALGLSDAQIKAFQEQQKTAEEAATKVRTFTQLIGTIKESVGSGWAQTFDILIGNFNEATDLFTGISKAIGGFVEGSTKARNELLKGWKELGGREQLILGFQRALHGMGEVIKPIREAFRDIFPPMTAKRLYELTEGFTRLMSVFLVAEGNGEKIRRAFRGVFAVFEIGWEVIKNFVGLIGDLLGSLDGVGNGALDFAANTGDTLTALNKALVAGGGIRKFFEKLGEAIRKPIEFIRNLRENVVEFFKAFRESDPAERAIDRLGDRFEGLRAIVRRVQQVFAGIKKVFDKAWEYISTWMSELWGNMADALASGDTNQIVDVLNVGLVGGIALMLRKFLKNGLNIDFGGGILENLQETFGNLTGVLKSMQTELKSRALMQIAIALGVLTVSVVALSLIDSDALAKALVGLTVGFGQLVGAMALMEQMTTTLGAAKLGMMAAGMILLAGAAVILSVAIKNLSSLGWEELAKGLVGAGTALVGLTASTQLIAANTGGMVRAGIAMIGISIALLILSKAVKEFAEMDWGEMAQGLVGVAVGLGVVVGLMNAMPPGMAASGLGMILLAAGMLVLQKAVEAFAEMSWSEMGKGFVGVAAGLVIVAAAMNAMPPHMALMAAGLILVGVAMNILAKAVASLGELGMGELAKGIGAMAAMLVILSAAMIAMQGSMGGAAALIVVAGALHILSNVLIELSQLSFGELAMGLGAIAAVLVVLGLAALILQPVIPAMLALGVALGLVGVSFALFGVGAMAVAKAFELMAKAGKAGMAGMVAAIRMLIGVLPELIGAFIYSLTKILEDVLNAAPMLLELVTVLLSQILDTIIELVPKIAEALSTIVLEGIRLIRELFPDILTLGFDLLTQFMLGLRNNIPALVVLATGIIVNFANAMSMQAEKLVNAGIRLLFSFLNAIAARAGDIAFAGMNVLLSFIGGIAANVFRIVNTVGTIISMFIQAVGDNVQKVIDAGVDVIVNFIEGIGKNAYRIINAGTDTIIEFIKGLGRNALKLAEAAMDVVVDFVDGLADAIDKKNPEIQAAGKKLAGAMIDGMTFGLASKAGDVAGKAVDVAKGGFNKAKGWLGIDSPSKKFIQLGKAMAEGMAVGLDKDTMAENSAVQQAERIVKAFHESLVKAQDSAIALDNVEPVITPVLDLTKVEAEARNLDRLMKVSSIAPAVSLDQARLISATASDVSDSSELEPAHTGPREIKFEQNNYSPKPLSAHDIYRSTKSQIALAKEELDIE